MIRKILIYLLLFSAVSAMAENRFPKPQFEKGYLLPQTVVQSPRAAVFDGMDVAVLFASLSLATWLILKKRSRRGVFLLSVFSLIYFGFWRKGCICSIGAIQNVTLWMFDSQYVLPLTVAAFFALPLMFSLLFGRVFCAGVCPFGAIQDLMILFPVRLPRPVVTALKIVPHIYLGSGVLFAAAGAAFIICRLDPFVALFRLSGDLSMVLFGVILLLIGIFVARPYCRFMCPFSVLLNWSSKLSKWHAKITPDECVVCRLCEQSCPFDAIITPNKGQVSEERSTGLSRLIKLLLLLPVLVLLVGWSVSRLDVVFSKISPDVQLVEAFQQDDKIRLKTLAYEVEAFEGSGMKKEELFAKAATIQRKLRLGGWLFGGFLGAVFGIALLGVSVRRTRETYEPDRGDCLSCARCFKSCPKERQRLKSSL